VPTTLITGANRGLGLEFARQYREAGWRVEACCRTSTDAGALDALAELGGVTVHRMDVTDQAQIDTVARALRGTPIDILFNNAGIADGYGIGVAEGKDDPDLAHYDHDQWLELLNVNVVSQGRVTGAFAPHVAASDKKMIAMMTSGLGSVGNTWQGGRYAYRTSKAALNMLARSVAAWLEPRGVTVIAIAPGWARTGLGGPNAPNSVEHAVAGVRRVLDGLTIAETGSYWNFDGTRLPW